MIMRSKLVNLAVKYSYIAGASMLKSRTFAPQISWMECLKTKLRPIDAISIEVSLVVVPDELTFSSFENTKR